MEEKRMSSILSLHAYYQLNRPRLHHLRGIKDTHPLYRYAELINLEYHDKTNLLIDHIRQHEGDFKEFLGWYIVPLLQKITPPILPK